jgi:hypothetical protein
LAAEYRLDRDAATLLPVAADPENHEDNGFRSSIGLRQGRPAVAPSGVEPSGVDALRPALEGSNKNPKADRPSRRVARNQAGWTPCARRLRDQQKPKADRPSRRVARSQAGRTPCARRLRDQQKPKGRPAIAPSGEEPSRVDALRPAIEGSTKNDSPQKEDGGPKAAVSVSSVASLKLTGRPW